jgi:uncharacterized protein (TIGR01244 family)
MPARRGPALARSSFIAAGWLIAAVAVAGVALAQDDPIAANHVIVDARLHTSGQPSAAMLEQLGDRGFDTVINLAPPTAQGAVAEQRALLEAAGVSYANIPVDFRNPTYADFEQFSAALDAARAGQVLVHCQINARGSTFTFLYRVVHEQAPPAEAFELVRRVWQPNDVWRAFARDVLARNGIAYELP